MLHLFDILLAVVLVESQWLLLGRTLNIGLILQQLLDAEQDLFDGDVRLPVLLLIQDGEADCPRRVDVGMREDRLENTFRRANSEG
jgi:hypothetical protein